MPKALQRFDMLIGFSQGLDLLWMADHLVGLKSGNLYTLSLLILFYWRPVLECFVVAEWTMVKRGASGI